MIITTQMLRDKLGFKGPLSVRGLEQSLGLKYADFAAALAQGVVYGSIKIRKPKGLMDLPLYYTTWVDDVHVTFNKDRS